MTKPIRVVEAIRNAIHLPYIDEEGKYQTIVAFDDDSIEAFGVHEYRVKRKPDPKERLPEAEAYEIAETYIVSGMDDKTEELELTEETEN